MISGSAHVILTRQCGTSGNHLQVAVALREWSGSSRTMPRTTSSASMGECQASRGKTYVCFFQSAKSGIYHLYAEHAIAGGYRQVAKSTFGKLWGELCPFTVAARPTTDLCWRCQRNIKIYRSTNLTLEEKDKLLLEQQRHISQMEEERQLYKMTAGLCGLSLVCLTFVCNVVTIGIRLGTWFVCYYVIKH